MARRITVAAVTLALAAATLVIASPAVHAAAAPSVAPSGSTLRIGSALGVGQSLRSPNGAYALTVGPRGRALLRHGARVVWTSYGSGSHARLVIRRYGDLAVMVGARRVWSTETGGSMARTLTLGNDGVLRLRSAGGTVWSSLISNVCRQHPVAGKRVAVDLSRQFARLCDGRRQVLTTPITSGASAYGNATPTGTWRVQSKQRERYLYPAAGGAYYVHYWIPYDGAYGMHDSSWQNFPYGSPLYRTRGSHGCVHFPLAAIRWMYRWLQVGTLVQIRA